MVDMTGGLEPIHGGHPPPRTTPSSELPLEDASTALRVTTSLQLAGTRYAASAAVARDIGRVSAKRGRPHHQGTPSHLFVPHTTASTAAAPPPPAPPPPPAVAAKMVVGDPHTRPEEDTVFIPKSFALVRDTRDWESTALVPWAMHLLRGAGA